MSARLKVGITTETELVADSVWGCCWLCWRFSDDFVDTEFTKTMLWLEVDFCAAVAVHYACLVEHRWVYSFRDFRLIVYADVAYESKFP
jgi:hypothetical protein